MNAINETKIFGVTFRVKIEATFANTVEADYKVSLSIKEIYEGSGYSYYST